MDYNEVVSDSKADSLTRLKRTLKPFITEMVRDSLAEQADSLIPELIGRYFRNRLGKMPILNGEAQVEVRVMSKRKSRRYHGRGGYLGFGKQRRALLHFASLDCTATRSGTSDVTYSGTFSIDMNDPGIGKPISYLEQAEFIQIGFSPLAPQSRVLGGKAVVLINNTIRYEYKIPPQMMASNFILITNMKNRKMLNLATNGPPPS